MSTKGNIFLTCDRALKMPFSDIEQLVHEIEICNIAEHYGVNSGTIEYFYNRYGILPVINTLTTEYYTISKKMLSNLSRRIKVMKLKNNIRHVQLSKNN
jgi:hypothetical protein